MVEKTRPQTVISTRFTGIDNREAAMANLRGWAARRGYTVTGAPMVILPPGDLAEKGEMELQLPIAQAASPQPGEMEVKHIPAFSVLTVVHTNSRTTIEEAYHLLAYQMAMHHRNCKAMREVYWDNHPDHRGKAVIEVQLVLED